MTGKKTTAAVTEEERKVIQFARDYGHENVHGLLKDLAAGVSFKKAAARFLERVGRLDALPAVEAMVSKHKKRKVEDEQ